MGVFKRSDSPYYHWKLQHKGVKHGGSTGTKNKAEAWKYFTEQEELIKNKKLRFRDKTYGDLVDHYIGSFHPNDQATLRWTLRFLADKKLSHLTGAEIKNLQEYALARRKASSVNRMFNTVRSILNRALRSLGWIDQPIIWSREKEIEPERKVLSKEEEKRLLKELPPHLRRIVEFALETGFRKTMIVSLTMDMLDLEKGTLKIPARLNKKTGKNFEPIISERAIELILEEEGSEEEKFGLRFLDPKRPIFTYQGKVIKNPAGSAWYKALKRAGLDITFHSLRHTWATRLIEKGESEYLVAWLGGWTTTKMLKTYVHINPSMLQGLERLGYRIRT